MMKVRLMVLLVLALGHIPLGQAGQRETQRVEGLEFSQLLVHGSVEVELRQGEPAELVVRGKSAKLEKQPFFVDGDTLVVGRSRHGRGDFGGLQFKIVAPNLERLLLEGSGEVFVKPLQVGDLVVALKGSGDIKMFEVEAAALTLHLSGSGDIQVAQLRAQELSMVLSGSGDIDVQQLEVEEMEASVNGSGDLSVEEDSSAQGLVINVVGSGDVDLEPLGARDARVNIVGSGTARMGFVERALEVNIMGSGDVYHRGEPAISQSILGSGDIHRDQ